MFGVDWVNATVSIFLNVIRPKKLKYGGDGQVCEIAYAMNFIRLSTGFINVSFIRTIDVKPSLYTIRLHGCCMSGWMLAGTGLVDNSSPVIHVSKEKDAEDYIILSKFIEQLKM